EILADPPGLAFIQLPVAYLDRVEPRPLEDFVAIDVDNLLDRARVNACETADALDELPLRLIRIGAPTAAAPASHTPISQARERILGLLPGIRRIVDRVLHFVLVLRIDVAGIQGRAGPVSLERVKRESDQEQQRHDFHTASV